jgi:hypothetical protein
MSLNIVEGFHPVNHEYAFSKGLPQIGQKNASTSSWAKDHLIVK